jgi:GPH family glycoside/pentoside/hexuronide:cation symporter
MTSRDSKPNPEDPTTALTDVQLLSGRRLLGFSVGSVGGGLFSTLPGLLLLFYLTDTLGVPAAIAGVVVLIPKLWDVLFNPLVGALSDREALRTGHRTRFMLLGAVTIPIGLALMFSSPFTGLAGAAWVFVAFFLASTAFACFQVPYVTLPTEMSPNPTERIRVMGWRIIAVTVGVLFGGSLAPFVIDLGGGGQDGYQLMGVGAAGLMFTTFMTATLATRWVSAQPGTDTLGLQATFSVARGNRAFLILISAYSLQILGIAMTLASIAYVATYLLENSNLTSALFAVFVAPSIIAVPLWSKLANRVGKHRVYQLVTVLLAVGAALMWPVVQSGNSTLVLAVVLFQGIAFAGQQVLPWAMLPDTILADELRTGRVQAGAFTGAFTALETAMFAIGPGVFSIVLALSGFVSSTFENPVEQSSAALSGILAGYTLVPALLLLFTVPIISRYASTEACRIGNTHTADSSNTPVAGPLSG